MDLLNEFKNYLFSQDDLPAKVTVKNYLSDINHFIRWYEKEFNNSFNPTLVSYQTITHYKLSNTDSFSQSSMERHLSSLRKFFKFLKLEGKISANPFVSPLVSSEAKESDPWHLKEFKNYLYVYNASHLTIKNYIIDIRQFLSWVESVTSSNEIWNTKDRNILSKIDNNLLEEYKNRLMSEGNFSPTTVNRKLSSLRKYLSWAEAENYVSNINSSFSNISQGATSTKAELNKLFSPALATIPQAKSETKIPTYSKFPPIRLFQKISKIGIYTFDQFLTFPFIRATEKISYLTWLAKGKPVFMKIKSSKAKIFQSKAPVIAHNPLRITNVKKEFYAPLEVSTAYFPKYKKIWFNLRYRRPKWYAAYHSYPITHYFHFAILIIFMAVIGFGFYQSFFQKPQTGTPALAAIPQSPIRILSFQGRLTDNQDNPISTSSALRFAIYNAQAPASGSALLWQEVDSVSPDQDGIFSVLLGNAGMCPVGQTNPTGPCGIPPWLFASNSALFLGVSVNTTPEMTPRQQLATVAYAANSETLQGLLPITGAGAGTSNVVLALDSSGNLTIGGTANPTFQASGGQFTISGQPLLLTTNVGSNNNVTLSADGWGKIAINKPLMSTSNSNNISTAVGSVEVDSLFSVLASSSGQSAVTINQTGTGPLISASQSGTAKFTVDGSGNTTIASGAVYAVGTANGLSLTNACVNTTGGIVTGTGTCPTQTGTNWWNQLAGALSPVNTTNDFLLGSTATSSALFSFTGIKTGQTIASASGQLIVMPNNGYGGQIAVNKATSLAGVDIKDTNSLAVLGTEKITNAVDQNFSAAGNWTTIGSPPWRINIASSGVAAKDAPGTGAITLANGFLSGGAPAAGNTYQITFDFTTTASSSGSLTPSFGGTNGVAIGQDINMTQTAQTQIITAAGTGALTFTPTALWYGTIDNISVKLITPSSIALRLESSDGTGSPVEFRTGGTSLYNLFIGQGAGQSNTTGDTNSFFGANAGKSNLGGWGNSFFGYIAGQNNTSGNYNAFLGSGTGNSNTTGSYNTFLGGLQAGSSNTTGSWNTFLGTYAGNLNTTGGSNSFVGYSAGQNNTTGSNNSFFGYSAGQNNTTGNYNVFMGWYAGQNNTTANYNVMLGYQAGANSITGLGNVVLGYGAGGGTGTGMGNYNVLLGYQAGYNNSASNNSFLGFGAGLSNTTGSNNNAFGSGALYSNQTSSYNNAFGSNALRNTTANYNNAFGDNALQGNTTGSNNNAFGGTALYSNQTGNYNSAFGGGALSNILSSNNNSAFGFNSGLNTSTGENNTFLGYQAGQTNIGGGLNTLLGYNADVGSGHLINAGAIGARALVNQNNSLVLGSINGVNSATGSARIAIGTISPTASLDLQGGNWGGNAALIINQNGASTNDIFVASASGITKFQLTNVGALNLVGGQTSDIDTLTGTTLKIGASTATTLTLGRSGQGITLPRFNAQNGVLYGTQTTGVLAQATTATSGQCLLSGASNPGWATCPASGVNWWNELAGALSPLNTTDDLLLGSTATSTAKFAFTGLGLTNGQTQASFSGQFVLMPNTGYGGSATIAGQLTLGALGNTGANIQSVKNQQLTIGGNTTGDITFAPGNSSTSLYLASTGNVGIGTINPAQKLEIDNSGHASIRLADTTNSQAIALGSTKSGNAGPYIEYTGDLIFATRSFAFVGSGGTGVESARITSAGFFLPASNNTQDIGSSTLQWRNLYANGLILPLNATYGGLWQRNLGALAPMNITDDLLIGATATTTAQFSITNIAKNQAVASLSGQLIVMPNTGWGGFAGIATTNPISQLQVNANTLYSNSETSRHGLMITSGDTLSANTELYMGADDTNSVGYLQAVGHSGYRALTLNGRGGSVSVGTTNSGSKFNVNGNASIGTSYTSTAAPTNGLIVQGNVGIGTSSPLSQLHVSGGTTGGRSALIVDQLGVSTNDVFTASSSGATQLYLTNGGALYARSFYDLDNSSYFLDPAATGTSLQTVGSIVVGTTSPLAKTGFYMDGASLGNTLMVINQQSTGDLIAASSSGTTSFLVKNNGDTVIGNGGAGKLTATTLDPLYTIDGTKYSTYAPSMVGVKEEVTGKATLTYNQNQQLYSYTINLNNQEQGSDLWLFSRVTDPDINLLTALLTPDSSAKVWYDKNVATRSITFFSDRPTNLSYRLSAPRFDHNQWANLSDETNPSITGLIAPPAPGQSTISAVLAGASMSGQIIGPDNSFTISQALINGVLSYNLIDGFGNVIRKIDNFSNLLVANLQTGAVLAKEIATDMLSTNYLTVDNKLISPIAEVDIVRTNLISPIGDVKIALKLENDKLSIVNGNSASASAVSSFDNQGNATFSGSLTANEASISGTLRAGKIIADQIEGLNIQAATVSANYITNNYYASSASGNLTSNQFASGSANYTLATNGYIDISSYSGLLANIDKLNAQSALIQNLSVDKATFTQGLMAFGSSSFAEVSVVDQLSVSGNLILANSAINALGSDLQLQPLKQGGLSVMAGLFYIDTSGNVKVSGNAEFAQDVTVGGKLSANVISPIPGNNLTLDTGSSSLEVRNASNAATLSLNNLGDIIASGSGTFGKLNLSLVQPVYALSSTEVVATGSAGTASIRAYYTEVTIDNPLVTEKSLIYVTPKSNQPVYLMRQVSGVSFTVGVQNPSLTDIPFNWIIVN